MPFVRIDLPRGKSLEYRRTLGDVVYEAMIQTINVPANDRFQVITEHPTEGLIVDRTYLGIERSPECVLIQVFLNEGRTTELKKAFYKAIAEGLHQRLGLRKQDVFITLVEVKKENWSFGNGEAQYA
ncbi:MAG TPA: tautomerase family protein [Myxococcaceae bacterium]|jgi:phenylpyruvate tautomerase PptA (4-oxalocrotonate tautomerase family)